jgi:predicted ATP-grasp superfamily ATP-dependent carboligase
MNQTHVIVVPANNHIALNVIRSLGRNGCYVTAISTGSYIAHTSRYCSKVIFTRPEKLAEATYNAAKNAPGAYILCLGELEILSPNERREQLESVAGLLFPDSRRFALALHKERTLALAERIGIPVPKTIDLADDPQLLRCRELQFPVVIKPKSQDIFDFKVLYAESVESLISQLDALKSQRDLLLIQEKIAGDGVGIEILVKDRNTVLAFQHRRIREDPPSGGYSVCCESEPLDQTLLEYSEKLLAAMDWDGVAMVEFKVDPVTGRVALMEVNGRFWGSLPLAIHAGADFPSALVACNLPEPMTKLLPYRIHLRCRRLIGETKWLVTVIKQGTVPIWKAVGAYLWDFRPGVKYFIWAWDDPRPALYALQKRAGITASIVLE